VNRALRAPRVRRLQGVSLRLRLVLLSTALLGATLLLFAAVVYVFLAETLNREVDASLKDRARVVRDSVRVDPGPGGRPFLNLSGVDAISGGFVQVVFADGTVFKSDSLGTYSLPYTEETRNATQRGQEVLETIEVDGADLRLYSGPLVPRAPGVGMLQVARPLGPTKAVLAVLRFVLLVSGLASVIVSVLLGLLAARAALRPIDQLTREAEQIGLTQDFGRRVSPNIYRRTDEVGRLAATFNAMLDRIQEAFGALQGANERLEAGLESQRRFVADASHELRTPLTTVRGNASLLRRFDRLTPEDRKAAVQQIVAESERMSRLVNDLLTLARADAGQLLERQSLPLGALLDDVALQGKVLADEKVAISVVRLAEADVLGDADALRQLLLLLVDNAIKYTPAGGSVTLGLNAEDDRTRGLTARISVVDTGVGIPAADLPHIFERFYRADRARQSGGTGLGLAIGKWIAEAHGGTITVESSPGNGSIFTVTLPALSVTPLRPDFAPPPPSPPLPPPARPALAGS
jgi:two-component system, OmpR family, sensor kinase